MNNELMKKLSPYIYFDVDSEDKEPNYDYQERKALMVFKKHFEGTPHGKTMEKNSGDTLYKTLKQIPLATLVAYAMGKITADNVVSVTKGEVQPIGMYLPFEYGDSPKELFDLCREACRVFNKYRDEGYTGEEDEEETTKVDPMEAMRKAARQAGLDLDELLGNAEAIETLREKYDQLALIATTSMSPVNIPSDGTIPEGKMEFKKVHEVFPDVDLNDNIKNMDIPVFTWAGYHPDVPTVDEHYIFRPEYLARALYSFLTNQRMYIHGHTGSGKTTLIEQMAARIQFPFIRINFDSEITRMDLIGRDKVKGGTSWFEDGILPRALSQPCVVCFDEIDFTRPDVAYVMQAVNEGNGLRITEDGDRFVQPNEWCRMFATGNTVGQGDEFGMYQGARPQSLAFLDRYTVWLKVDYLDEEGRKTLIERHNPTIRPKVLDELCAYVTEHLEAFKSNRVLQPISPRGILAVAKAAVTFGDLREALEMTILARASEDDKSTLEGLMDRTVG